MHPCAIVVCSGARWQEYWDGEELYKAPLIIAMRISLFYSKYLAEFLVDWLFDELCICFRWEVFKVVSVSFFYTGSATCSPERETLAFQVPQALLSPALHPAVAPDPGPAKEAVSIREASCFFGWTTICPSAKASAVFWRSLGSALAKLKIVLINISNLKPNCSVCILLPSCITNQCKSGEWGAALGSSETYFVRSFCRPYLLELYSVLVEHWKEGLSLSCMSFERLSTGVAHSCLNYKILNC